MQISPFVLLTATLAITFEVFEGCEGRTHKAHKSFKFGGDQSVGLYSIPPALKRMYEHKTKKNHRRNGAVAGVKASKSHKYDKYRDQDQEMIDYNQQYLKSYRSPREDYNRNHNNVNKSNYYQLAPAPPLNNDVSVSNSAVDEELKAFVDSWENDSSDLLTGAAPFGAAVEYANKYLKAKIRTGAEVDDLEVEYANGFLKRGLKLANDSNEGKYDEQFMATLKRFYASLLQKSAPFIPNFNYNWRAVSGEAPYRTDRLYAKNKSIDCGNLSMKLKMVDVIYGGQRNRVIKLYDKATRKYYAYKTYGNPDEFYAEQEMFLWIDHPYFVKAVCHRQDFDTGKPGILFDYIDGMSSLDYARTATLEQLKSISAQLFLAIEYLHWLGILHADLKPENLLVRRDGTVQVIDLGFATHLPQGRRGRGTHTTMAPELHNLVPGRIHEAIDWWAYGSTVAMWFGYNDNYRNLESNRRFIPMAWQKVHYVDGVVPNKFTWDMRNFMAVFFQPNPENRRFHTKRLLKQLRNDPFFSGINWENFVGGILN